MARGDHLYVEDTLGGIPFQHHGIDMGDGTVIHLAPADGARVTLRDTSERFCVHRVTKEQFATGRDVRIRFYRQPRSSDQIAAHAESMLGRSGYSLLEGNCEHFATLCVTGKPSSHQIEMSHATVASLASAATKTFWAISSRLGAQTAVRSAAKIHPAAMLADGVEVLALTIGCRRGLEVDEAKRVAKISGNLAAASIGAVVGGPVGAAMGLAAHAGSRAVAEKVCLALRRTLG